jgi:hypothetical protein
MESREYGRGFVRGEMGTDGGRAMSDTAKKPISTALTPTSQGELVVIPTPPPPTLEERAMQIRIAHNDVATAVLTAVERALDAGLQLIAAKEEVGHGRFETYVARCGISMRAAQNYMRLAKHEAKVRELVNEKAQGNAYLTMPEALKHVAGLDAKKKPKRRASSSRMLKMFGMR